MEIREFTYEDFLKEELKGTLQVCGNALNYLHTMRYRFQMLQSAGGLDASVIGSDTLLELLNAVEQTENQLVDMLELLAQQFAEEETSGPVH